MNRSLLWLLCAMVVATGCHSVPRRYEPVGHSQVWDPVLGDCHTCGVCQGGCEGHTPISYTKHVLTCRSGCGELYWGPWISDPPECDPCDNWGNHLGAAPPKKSFWHHLAGGWHQLWGHRNGADCGGCGACGTCGSEATVLETEHWELESDSEKRHTKPGPVEAPSEPMTPEA